MGFPIGTATEIKYLLIALSLQLKFIAFYYRVMLYFHVSAVGISSSLMLHLEIPLGLFLFQLKHINTFR